MINKTTLLTPLYTTEEETRRVETMPLTQATETLEPVINEGSDHEDILNDVKVEDLTGLFDVPVDLNQQDDTEQLKQLINRAKRFYLDNFNYQINLCHDSFVRLSGIRDFGVGYKYKNLVEKMEKVELLTQLVNERHKLRVVCKTMYYRETSLRLDNKTNSDLLCKYLGLGLKENRGVVKQELKENSWFLKVYRDRLLFVSDLLESKYKLTKDEIKSVRDYDDVLNFV